MRITIIPKHLYRVNSLVFTAKLTLLVGIVSFCFSLIILQIGFLSIPFQFILGIMFAHAVELQHQCLHHTAFQSKRLNRLVGFLLGLPMLVSFSHYRASHLTHHAALGTSKDTEFFSYDRNFSSWSSLLFRAYHFGRYRSVARNVIDAFCNRTCSSARNKREAESIQIEYVLLSFLVLIAIASSLILGSALLLKIWILPLVLSAEAAHFLIELPEHIGCDRETTDVLCNTRTIVGTKFSAWLTNGNNFHVEHHFSPQVPIDKLPRVHGMLSEHIKYEVPSYWRFFSSITRGSFDKKEKVSADIVADIKYIGT